MTHGQADFGAYAATKTIFPQADLSELAVRLGSIVSFDRRGNVIWMDDFESSVEKWTDSYTGGNGTWVLSPDSPHNGTFSGKLSTAAAVSATATISRIVGYPAETKFGYEIAFNHGSNARPLVFTIQVSDGTYVTTFRLTYNSLAQTLTILDENGAEQTIESSYSLLNDYWHKFKMVIALETLYYTRLLIDNRSWDLSSYMGESAAVSIPYTVGCFVKITSISALASSIYVDDCIFTQNEP